jgi:hypothetical protein
MEPFIFNSAEFAILLTLLKTTLWVLVTALGLLAAALPLVAHRSFQAKFDRNRIVHIQGTVRQLKWKHPRVQLVLDAANGGGDAVMWSIELSSPKDLRRRGWIQQALRPGDVVAVEGYVAKDGSKMASARKITLAGGKQMFAESPAVPPALLILRTPCNVSAPNQR